MLNPFRRFRPATWSRTRWVVVAEGVIPPALYTDSIWDTNEQAWKRAHDLTRSGRVIDAWVRVPTEWGVTPNA